jgi:hypothetical protein
MKLLKIEDYKDCDMYDIEVEDTHCYFVNGVLVHNCNASFVYDFSEDQLYAQSRNRVLSITSDNYGFAFWVESNKNKLKNIIDQLSYIATDKSLSSIVVYGEWAGPGIQKNVAISEIEKKSFFVFAAKLIFADESFIWVHHNWLKSENFMYLNSDTIYFIEDFETFDIEIDFNQPEMSINKMVELVNQVEKECPVGKAFGISGIGEGIVFSNQSLRFKCKGNLHSVTNTKTLIPVDEEKLNTVKEFVDYAVTENRLEQMMQKMNEFNIELTPKNVGVYFKFVNDDVIKEEMDTLIDSELEFKDVVKSIQNKARTYYLTQIGIL